MSAKIPSNSLVVNCRKDWQCADLRNSLNRVGSSTSRPLRL